jgi:hypothetical protein
MRQEERDLIIKTNPGEVDEQATKRPLSSRLRKLLIASTNALSNNPHYANCFAHESQQANVSSNNNNNSNPSITRTTSTSNIQTLISTTKKSKVETLTAESSLKTNTSALNQVIFLISPSTPSEHTMLVTLHRSRIRYDKF